jgi:hypothetical protein
MRFTESKDGIERCTVSVAHRLRLTRKELEQLTALAKLNGRKSIKEYIASQHVNIEMAMWDAISEFQESEETE